MRLTEHIDLVASGAAGFDLSDALDCHVYLIRGADATVLIDAGAGRSAGSIAARLTERRGRRLLLLTHGHADHAGGAAALSRLVPGLRVLAGNPVRDWIAAGDEGLLSVDKGKVAGVYPADYRFEPCPEAWPIEDGEKIDLGGAVLTALATPGHADGHMCYLLNAPEGRALFSGDCVFTGGRISLQNLHDCRVQEYARTVERLAEIPIDMLLPGHHEISLSRGGRHLTSARDVLARGLLPGSAT